MIEICTEVTEEFLEANARLVPQLSPSSQIMDREAAEKFFAQPGVYLFLFREEESGPIEGMLTLVTFQIPTGRRAWIEDVVVDSSARGKGAGKQLVNAAVAYADEIGVKTIDLTSRPTREAANKLYQHAGFVRRETNVYRFQH